MAVLSRKRGLDAAARTALADALADPWRHHARSELFHPADDFMAGHEWENLSPTLMGGFHEGFDIGIDRRAPVEWELFERRGTFAYTGIIQDVVVESGPFAPGSPFAVG